MAKNIGVLATGTWGTALARVLCKAGHRVTAWSISAQEIENLKTTKKHPNLPGMTLPEELEFTTEIREAVEGKDVILMAAPSPFVRGTCEKIKGIVKKDQIVACVAKGLEKETLFTMSEIIRDVLGDEQKVVALSGPTHAEEVALDLPTCIVSASDDAAAAKTVQELFVGTCIRPYTNDDMKGVEVCGALKNIMALACGISAGTGYGDNTKAAIMTRGLAEMTRLGRAMGCKEQTFSGLAGVGDLIVTATSMHSRNNRCGMYIGEGMKAQEAIEKVGMVVEGINALPAALAFAESYGVEIPISEAVNRVVNEGLSPREAVDGLLGRAIKSEV